MSDKIKCKCLSDFDEDSFKTHFSKCLKFKEAFREFDNEYGQLLKKYSQPHENLPILKFLLKQYINVIDNKIKKMKSDNPQPNDNSFQNQVSSMSSSNVNAPSLKRENEDNGINQNNKNNLYPINSNFTNNQNYQNSNGNLTNRTNNNYESKNNIYDIEIPPISSNLENIRKEVPKFPNNVNNYMSENKFNNNNMEIDHEVKSYSSREMPRMNNLDNRMIPDISSNINNNYDFNNKINPINHNQMKINDNSNFINSNLQYQNNNFNSSIKIENSNIDSNLRFEHENNYRSNNYPFYEQETETCISCGTIEDLFPLECFHMLCKNCFVSLAERDLNNIICKKPDCNQKVSYPYIQMILGEEKLSQLEKASVDRIVNEIGKRYNCPGCKELIVFEVGKVDYNIKDEKNQIISKQAAESYAQNRCKCPGCQKEFCVSCNITPFHLGKTCEEQKKFKEAKKCRFCNMEIKSNNKGPADNVCNAEDCTSAFSISCPKKLLCGHQCYGTKFDKNCPPCLHSECNSFVNYFDQNEDDYCNICFAEGLGSAPVILFSCKHYVHYKCADLCLKKKYIGPKITFNHMKCPRCKTTMDCPNTNPIQLQINENKQLYNLIVKMSLERLKFEGLEKDPLLTDKTSPYYNKPIDFALKKLSYYMCYECEKPYFAGLRDCRGGPDEDNNPNRQYDPKDLICGAHANIAGVGGITDCPKHGKDFIEYKCKFCCNIASWFCWGTTHFCEDCHARQCKGDYVSKYTKDKLPKCHGFDKCPLKVKHPENGEEYALGCSVCRNASDNYKNF